MKGESGLQVSERSFKAKTSLILSVTGGVLFLFFLYHELGLVSSYEVNSWTEDQHADCAVVLTGGAGRIREGLDMLSRREVARLIISGVHPQVSFAEIVPLWPFYGKIDERNIYLERRSNTTYGNAQQTLPLVETLRCQDLIIITSRFHMYRAMRTFQSSFPKELPLLAHSIFPGRGELGGGEVLGEAFKSLFYSLWAY